MNMISNINFYKIVKITKSIVGVFLIVFMMESNAALLFRDNFEYQVDPAVSSTCSRFVSSGGWEAYKSINCTGTHRGNIYTVSSIPGYSGSFPGANSTRALLIEQLPYSSSGGDLNAQTDIYLQFGGPTKPTSYIPANVWIQFWIYINRYGSQMSAKLEGKFIYPSPNGNYPANPAWLWGTRTLSYRRFWYETSNPGEQFFTNFPPGADDQLAEEWNQWKLGGNLGTASDGLIVPNNWYLIKMHVDTSGSSPLASAGQGVSEMWIRPLGSDWRKTAEWRGGVTPSFVWPISDSGNKSIRMPTTVAGGDEWVYLDDFAIATSEADLPTYSDSGVTILSAPTNFRIN